MFHKIKDVTAQPDGILNVQFAEGMTKLYRVGPLAERFTAFRLLLDNPALFDEATVDAGGRGIVWTGGTRLSCDEVWTHGEPITTSFDGLIALSDATVLWGLSESALRKAISYGKLVNGVDVCKFGKQWVVSAEAMYREYGDPMKQGTE